MSPSPRHAQPLSLALIVIAAVVYCGRVEAQIPPVQWQLLTQGSVDSELENPRGEVAVNIGIYGIGIALGLGGGASLREEGGARGWSAFADLAVQLRPLMLAASVVETHHPAYHIFDPHIDVGGLLGVHDEDDPSFLGVLYVGGALDFGIPVTYYWMQSQILVSVGYRFVPVQRPLNGIEHHFVLGLGFRGGY